MQHIALRHRFNCAVIIPDPAAVADMENICDIMSFASFFPVVINYSKEFVLLLSLLIFILRRHDF